jgi:hypothetical protein
MYDPRTGVLMAPHYLYMLAQWAGQAGQPKCGVCCCCATCGRNSMMGSMTVEVRMFNHLQQQQVCRTHKHALGVACAVWGRLVLARLEHCLAGVC